MQDASLQSPRSKRDASARKVHWLMEGNSTSKACLEDVSGARFASFCCSISAPVVVCGMLKAFRTRHCEHACCRDASMHQ